MNSSPTWVFVDDQRQDAESYVDLFVEAGLPILYVQSSEAREFFSSRAQFTQGVLMDVDFSGQGGALTTGLGLAQDIRAAQKRDQLRDFPIIRFANPSPVELNVGGDPSSNDLFDDFIPKSDAKANLGQVICQILLAQKIYSALEDFRRRRASGEAEIECLKSFFGLGEIELSDWVHLALATRIASTVHLPHHVAAGLFLRTVVNAVGVMVDWPTLSMRLGFPRDIDESEASKIKDWLKSAKFCGAGAEYTSRWWMAGVERSWSELPGDKDPLGVTPVDQRVSVLNNALGSSLEPLVMPRGSPGDRPWRWCQFSLERADGERVPVDTRFAVKLTPSDDLAPWVDPIVSSLGEAIRHRDDLRINSSERDKLKRNR